jgi:DNA mismatch repair protein MutL
VNKIAAGEVIERPASVVKELLENAIDAGATRVDVSLEQGGMELVRVVDNGHGIAPEQLPLALASHATSKIRDADDLFHVGTLGFRGEALASIAEISRLVIRSREPHRAEGAEIECVGGAASGPTPCGCSPGTSIEVRQLFFNTPVRRKFLRTPQTELAHCAEAFTRLALANPQVHFSFTSGGKRVHDLPPCTDLVERVAALLGRELADELLPVESSDGPVRLTGYVAKPEQSRTHNRMQYLFLNGRHIRDKALGHALGEAYRGLLMVGRFPITFLRLEMPPELVDVNVHPTKLEVRFQEGGRLYSQLLGTLRTRFLSTDLTIRVQPAAAMQAAAAMSWGLADANAAEALEQHRADVVRWAKGELAAVGPSTSGIATRWDERLEGPVPPPAAGLALTRLDPAALSERFSERFSVPESAAGLVAFPPTRQSASAPATPLPSPAPPARSDHGLQIHNRYLVTESHEGVVVIDQHALHERILYEQLRERVDARQLETQRLLVPEPVTLAPAEVAAVLDAKEVLAEIGIELEPFGGNTVLVNGYPAMLANFGPTEILRQAVEHLLSKGKPDHRELLDELLHMIACKAAIKAGDRLTGEEVTALLAQRHLVQDAHHCPHGRPTALVFTREELDRRFKRI